MKSSLKDKYEVVASCNNDMSAYLVPIGTEDQITYYGKPDKSFRISDHWNWYANIKKCKHEWYVQCQSENMPKAMKREDDYATKPRYGYQVAVFSERDHKYRAVFGEVFDKKTGTWDWLETKPEEVIKNLGF